MAQFDALLEILQLHIKKKTTNFCELSVQGSIYSALCCETKWMNLTIVILDFGIRFYGGSDLSNTSQNACHGCEKRKKSNPLYLFFNVRKFRAKNSDSVCNGLKSCTIF